MATETELFYSMLLVILTLVIHLILTTTGRDEAGNLKAILTEKVKRP